MLFVLQKMLFSEKLVKKLPNQPKMVSMWQQDGPTFSLKGTQSRYLLQWCLGSISFDVDPDPGFTLENNKYLKKWLIFWWNVKFKFFHSFFFILSWWIIQRYLGGFDNLLLDNDLCLKQKLFLTGFGCICSMGPDLLFLTGFGCICSMGPDLLDQNIKPEK